MSEASEIDRLLIGRIRGGEAAAWNELIARYEGRLLGYVIRRTPNRAAAEDVVQETFVGLLTSLPNYDPRQPLEGYLFSIAAHKLTDLLRREGRRPVLPLVVADNSSDDWQPADHARPVSSVVRSGERRGLEEAALAAALGEQIAHWQRRGQWDKLKCAELLLVRGWGNKEVAAGLGISEQTVANFKFEMIDKLRAAVRQQGLPAEVFPELYGPEKSPPLPPGEGRGEGESGRKPP
jgi:RNA polymerase sigma-70 factor (ECF subfamily)